MQNGASLLPDVAHDHDPSLLTLKKKNEARVQVSLPPSQFHLYSLSDNCTQDALDASSSASLDAIPTAQRRIHHINKPDSYHTYTTCRCSSDRNTDVRC